jgi:hypothetical protein
MREPNEDLRNADWWDYLKCENPCQIQWTSSCGGWVRARLDSITPWLYMECGDGRNALGLGLDIIQTQQKKKSPPC